MNAVFTITLNEDAQISDLAYCACGCECHADQMQPVRRDDVFDLYNMSYSAEREDLFCSSCIEWIEGEYQPSDLVDIAMDRKGR